VGRVFAAGMLSPPEKYPSRTDSLNSCKLLFNNPIQSEAEGILLRSRLQAAARRMGFSDMHRENMVLVAAEMVSNQIKYAGGRGILQIWQQPGPALDIVALDFGPGITNLAEAQQDGYSSSKTLGKGLGSIRSLSHESGIFTVPETKDANRNAPWHGCVFWSRFHLAHHGANHGENAQALTAKAAYTVGLFTRALSDDRYNGDRIYLEHSEKTLRWLHLDGLGHGEFAQQATNDLADLLFLSPDVSQVINQVDRQLKSTRGAVAMLSDLDVGLMQAQILGVGDMSAYVYSDDILQTITFAPGILGKEHKTPHVTPLVLKKQSTVITTSDGIRRGWNETSFPCLLKQHPQLIAYVLGNVMGRISDDQSLCIVRVE
jgi:anti-sigma regulatory factor (Ser/Thr protein kinase)